MKKYVKEFFHIGAMFAGFGPIIYAVIALTTPAAMSDGKTVFIAIISTYLLAFLQAGSSVFNRIEGWSLPKGLFFHLTTLYAAYITCYLVNSWLPFDALVIVKFTIAFVVLYLAVWGIVYALVKHESKKLNKNLK